MLEVYGSFQRSSLSARFQRTISIGAAEIGIIDFWCSGEINVNTGYISAQHAAAPVGATLNIYAIRPEESLLDVVATDLVLLGTLVLPATLQWVKSTVVCQRGRILITGVQGAAAYTVNVYVGNGG